jgi:hypothetical protein
MDQLAVTNVQVAEDLYSATLKQESALLVVDLALKIHHVPSRVKRAHLAWIVLKHVASVKVVHVTMLMVHVLVVVMVLWKSQHAKSLALKVGGVLDVQTSVEDARIVKHVIQPLGNVPMVVHQDLLGNSAV